jgi:ribosome biogenesis GTPase / thiamine phosphate phosphatase
MSKRKLNRRQTWRIEKIQQERLARAQKRATRAEDNLQSGELGEEIPGVVIAHFGTQIDVEPTPADGQLYRCHLRANLPQLVTGDRVIWCRGEPTGVVVAAEPRASELCRPDPHGRLKPVAANIDQIVIVIAPAPLPHANLVDRYLIAAEHTQIEPIILLNKTDLIDDNNRSAIDELLAVYPTLGYKVLRASTKHDHGLDELVNALQDRVSVFVGQSGVGKSSLISRLLPDIDLKVGALSEKTLKGTHTTTTAQLFHFPCGGDLIDSPGIREFGLEHLDDDTLASCFIEFRPFLGQCKFRDCQHKQEPQCALLKALADGHIHPRRFASFEHIRQVSSEY